MYKDFMKYFVVTKPFLKSPFRYYGMINNVGAPRTIAFKEKLHAESFRNFIIEYRSKHHEWPKINPVDRSFHHQNNVPLKKHSIESLSRHVHVIGWDDKQIEETKHNIHILSCCHFSFSTKHLNFVLKVEETENLANASQMRFILEQQI